MAGLRYDIYYFIKMWTTYFYSSWQILYTYIYIYIYSINLQFAYVTIIASPLRSYMTYQSPLL